MINDNDLLLLASPQNNGTYKVYIDSDGYKTLTPQTQNYTAKHTYPFICFHFSDSPISAGLLADKNPKKVIFPNCSEITGNKFDSLGNLVDDYDEDGAFLLAFSGCTSLTSVSFPVLTTATGGYDGGAFYRAFEDCTSLTSVSFPVLTTATGSRFSAAFSSAFANCTSLTSVSFPSLTTATGIGVDGTFGYAFENCTSLTSISFPSLTTATGGETDGAFFRAFVNCASLTSVSFPSLTTTVGSGIKFTFGEAFKGCSPSLKVHFKKSMKGKTGLDYKTMRLTSADQVVFDLP